MPFISLFINTECIEGAISIKTLSGMIAAMVECVDPSIGV